MKIIASDLDQTLVEYPLIKKISPYFLRRACLAIITWLSPRLQLRLAKPTPTYEKLKQSEVSFIVISGRTGFLTEPKKTVSKLLDRQPKEIHLKNEGLKPQRSEYKKETIQDLQKKYEIIAFIENDAKERRRLKQELRIPVIPPNPKEIEELEL